MTAPAGKHQHELLENEEEENLTFRDVGLCDALAEACASAGWTKPTRIQAATIPVAIQQNRDLVGAARTGSGKTGAYVLPIVHWLLMQKRVPFLSALALVPTRELADQVAEQFTMLGGSIGLKVVTLVGQQDMVKQAAELAKRPHVLVGTPGRVKDHLENTKGFQLHKLHWLVLDEADKMLDLDYEKEIDAILTQLPRDRQTMLFSATLSTKLDRLQKASLREPLYVQVHRKNSTVDTLKQNFIFCPFAQMTAYLHVYLARDTGNHVLIFCQSGALVHKLTLVLRTLGHRALPLMGKMTQDNRNLALNKFKDGKVRILVCTDLAQRGLDISSVDLVINYSLPLAAKEYIHRVGRTARAGSSGIAVNLVSQYDILQLQNIERTTGVTMEEITISDQEIEDVQQRVEDAELEAQRSVREHQQDEDLSRQHQRETHATVKKRQRSASGGGTREGYSDNRSGEGANSFSAMRMRRENEEVFDMTKKKRRLSIHEKKKEARGGGGGRGKK